MFKVTHNGTDISSYIYDLGVISYRRNDDMTFELPEITIQTSLAATFDDVVVVSVAADPAQQVSFIVLKSGYSYSNMSYTWTCAHILRRLDRYYTRDIDVAWSGISPTYAQYNTANPTSTAFWERSYWQVLFLIQTLIRKATGLSIASIDVSLANGSSGFYNRSFNQGLGVYYTSLINYESLGVSSQSLIRLGSQTHATYASSDYDEYSQMPTALEVLNLLCSMVGLTINIFSSNYSVSPVSMPTQPADDIQVGRTDRLLDRYRFVGVHGARLVVNGHDYEYGTFDQYNNLIPYEYGTQGADHELEKYEYTEENMSVSERMELLTAVPTHFALYVLSVSDYTSHIVRILDVEKEYPWWRQWLNMMYARWDGWTESRTFTVPLNGMSATGRSTEINVAELSKTYEVLI